MSCGTLAAALAGANFKNWFHNFFLFFFCTWGPGCCVLQHKNVVEP